MKLVISEEFHSIAPALDDAAKELLRESLKEIGCITPIIVWKDKGIIIDGHNRYEICQEERIPFRVFEKAFKSKDEAKALAVRSNLERRNLDVAQRTLFALQYVDLLRPKAEKARLASTMPTNRVPGSATAARSPSTPTQSGTVETAVAKKAPTSVLPSSRVVNDIGAANSRS